MKALVIGGDGLLGIDLIPALKREGLEVVSASRRSSIPLDITQPACVQAVLDSIRPDAVVLSAAATDVDALESDWDRAFRVNALGARNVAEVCRKQDIWLSYISTDYVFDGLKTTPYTEFDKCNPQSVYARSKHAGEQFVQRICPGSQVVRISGLYGPSRPGFPDRVLQRAVQGETLRLIEDQFYTPTSARQAARVISRLLRSGGPSIYHVTGKGVASPLTIGERLLLAAGLSTQIIPVSFSSWVAPAPRPRYSVLRHAVLEMEGQDDLETWEDEMDYFAHAWIKKQATVNG